MTCLNQNSISSKRILTAVLFITTFSQSKLGPATHTHGNLSDQETIKDCRLVRDRTGHCLQRLKPNPLIFEKWYSWRVFGRIPIRVTIDIVITSRISERHVWGSNKGEEGEVVLTASCRRPYKSMPPLCLFTISFFIHLYSITYLSSKTSLETSLNKLSFTCINVSRSKLQNYFRSLLKMCKNPT